MIDFRYHLVSIISIFLALAVGIVLGAGPLKGSIGTTLTAELANARQDKAELNTQLEDARRLQTSSNAFAGAVLDTVVAERLAGAKVAVVLGPQVDDPAAKAASDAVRRAGGEVVTTVNLTSAFLDTASAPKRTRAVDTLAGDLDVTADAASDRAGIVLARGLLEGAQGAPGHAAEAGTAAITGLVDAGLVKRPSAQPGVDGVAVPTLAVLVPGPVATTSAAETTAQLEAYLGLARGIDTVAAGTVLAASQAATTTPGSSGATIAAARRSAATSDRVTTVDDVDLPMGEAALVLALEAEPTGAVGRYGVRSDAQAVIAPLTTATASPSPSGSASSAPAR